MVVVFTSRRASRNVFLNRPLHRNRRQFSSTLFRAAGRSHYDTLSVPRNATRNQIKSNFYKISKEFHPDVNKAESAKATFQAASEAYSILGDERQRRAYDRSLEDAHQAQHDHRHNPSHPSSHPFDGASWSFEVRHRGASYAWERRSRTWQAHARPPPGTGRHYDPFAFDPWGGPRDFNSRESARSRANTHHRHPPAYDDFMRSPWANQNARGPAGKHSKPPDRHAVESMSHIGRAFGVIALVLLVSTIGGGGWTARA